MESHQRVQHARPDGLDRNGVPAMVAEHALLTPGAIAVSDQHCAITYAELENCAAHCAAHLQELGVGRDVVVGICFERSVALIVAALAVLKSGGAYLPLDPTTPLSRRQFVLDDAQASVLITSAALADEFSSHAPPVLILDREGKHLCGRNTRFVSNTRNPDDLAYVIYTSGSTGQPKGVEISHSSLDNLIAWHREAFAVDLSDRATGVASPGFDAAVWEVWPYLTAGASLHIPTDATVKDPERLRDWIVDQRITISFAPTPLAEHLMQLSWPQRTALRYLLTGADTLRRYPPETLPFAVVNNYGPTECTVVTTSGRVTPGGRAGESLPPIGRSIKNVAVHILDESMQPVRGGTPGELYVGGAAVARGYRNRPELTAERFVPNPFVPDTGARLYKTGDIGAYLTDGQIAFMGRSDEQVKVRGYRVELAEVEGALERHPLVRAGVAAVHESTPGNTQLIAYVVPEPGSNLTAQLLRDDLLMTLPEYMVPTVFFRLDAIPITANGKIDRKDLPSPDSATALDDEEYVAPRTPVEQRLASMLTALLKVDRVGVHDNFFMLGGNSLLGAQVIARVRDSFGVELLLLTLFDHPTVAELSVEIENLALAQVNSMSDADAARVIAGEIRS